MVSYNTAGPSRDRVLKLIEQKDKIEREIQEQTAILETNNIGLSEPLVDSEGFPRNDIDVYKVRHARHRIICLQNDHKSVMKAIESGLAEVHAGLIGSNSQHASLNSNTASTIYTNGLARDIAEVRLCPDVSEQCFVSIGFVHNGSPADLAGLLTNDEVLQFGTINHTNFTDVTQIQQLVSHSVGQRITVRVRREQNVLNLTIVPRPWSHPGLLGCQILTRTAT